MLGTWQVGRARQAPNAEHQALELTTIMPLDHLLPWQWNERHLCFLCVSGAWKSAL